MCAHPTDKVRFLACSAADRFPGMWVCDECGDSFRFDPLGRTTVKYLDHPNPNATKTITFEPEIHREKMS